MPPYDRAGLPSHTAYNSSALSAMSCSDQAELDEVLRALGGDPPDDRLPDEADARPVATALAGLPAGGRTVTVRVRIPPEASWLPAYPLDLAIPPGSGEPLALLPIRLVYEVAGAAVEKQPAGRRLRVLAILSTPSGGVTLDLRREPAPWSGWRRPTRTGSTCGSCSTAAP